MKFNLDIDGEPVSETPPETKVVHVRDSVPEWKIRGDRFIAEGNRKSGRFCFPDSLDSWVGFLGSWFILPLAYSVVFSLLEQRGWDLRGFSLLTLAFVVGVGTYLYTYLRAFPDDFPAVLCRIITFAIALGLGVGFSAF